jgi:hypothetical protein
MRYSWAWLRELVGGSDFATATLLLLFLGGLTLPSAVFKLMPLWLSILLAAIAFGVLVLEGGYRHSQQTLPSSGFTEIARRTSLFDHRVTESGNGVVIFETGGEANPSVGTVWCWF